MNQNITPESKYAFDELAQKRINRREGEFYKYIEKNSVSVVQDIGQTMNEELVNETLLQTNDNVTHINFGRRADD